jgi:hypothetical protein
MNRVPYKPLSEVEKEVDKITRQERLAPQQKWQSPKEQYTRVLAYFQKHHNVGTWKEIQTIPQHRKILEGFLNEDNTVSQDVSSLISWMNHYSYKETYPTKKRKKRQRPRSSGQPSKKDNCAVAIAKGDIGKPCDEYCCCMNCLHK